MDPLVKAALSSLAESGDFDRLLANTAKIVSDWFITFGEAQRPDEAALDAEELTTFVLAIVRKSQRETGDQYMRKDNLRWARERVRARM
jgi:hypothetical protein